MPRKTNEKTGGVGFYARAILRYSIISFESAIEQGVVATTFTNDSRRTHCLIYRPQTCNLTIFMPEFEKHLVFLKTMKIERIIIRDFNIDTLVESTEKRNYLVFPPHFAIKILNTPELQQLQVDNWIMYLLQILCRLKLFRQRCVTTTHCNRKFLYLKMKTNKIIIWCFEILKILKVECPELFIFARSKT